MPGMVSAYIHWCAEAEMTAQLHDEGLEEDAEEEVYGIQVVDMFGELPSWNSENKAEKRN